MHRKHGLGELKWGSKSIEQGRLAMGKPELLTTRSNKEHGRGEEGNSRATTGWGMDPSRGPAASLETRALAPSTSSGEAYLVQS